jgi:hypothetical protein
VILIYLNIEAAQCATIGSDGRGENGFRRSRKSNGTTEGHGRGQGPQGPAGDVPQEE